jgi:hypothetical protein
MAILRKQKKESFGTERPSVLVQMKVVDKEGYPMDPQLVWDFLQKAFAGHAYYVLHQAEFHPDKESTAI